MKKNALLIALLCALLGLSACGEPEDTRPGQPVAKRQQAFKAIFRAFDPISSQLKKDQLDMAELQTLAAQLAERRHGPWEFFGPDTQYPPSHTKDAAWSDRPRFDQEKQQFLDATDHLLAAIKNQDRQQIQAAYIETRDRCESCHKLFKGRAH